VLGTECVSVNLNYWQKSIPQPLSPLRRERGAKSPRCEAERGLRGEDEPNLSGFCFYKSLLWSSLRLILANDGQEGHACENGLNPRAKNNGVDLPR
jgi:hypothetical protein